jgi:hypothetical protein
MKQKRAGRTSQQPDFEQIKRLAENGKESDYILGCHKSQITVFSGANVLE